MTIMPGLLCILLIGAQVHPPLTPEERKQKITNFFHHMKELQAEEDARPEAVANHPEGGLATFKFFPFEAYAHLNVRDLMRAAREGIDDAERVHSHREPAVIERHARENVAFVFEFLPLLVVESDELRFIRYVLEDPNEHVVLRRFVMDQLIPAEKPRSHLQLYLQDQIVGDRDSFKRLLGSMITLSFERPEFRERAMELLYRLTYLDYLDFFHEDENVARFMETHDRTLLPRELPELEGFQLTNRTRTRFQQQTEGFVNLAQLYARSFDPLEAQPERTQRVARQLIERILADIPLANPEVVEALLPEAEAEQQAQESAS